MKKGANVHRVNTLSINELLVMYKKSGTVRDIAKKVGVTYQRVQQLLSKHPGYATERERRISLRKTISPVKCKLAGCSVMVPQTKEVRVNGRQKTIRYARKYCSARCVDLSIERKRVKRLREPKVCTVCNILKLSSEFYPMRVDGVVRQLTSHCKNCHTGYVRTWLLKNRKRYNAYFREYIREYNKRPHVLIRLKSNHRRWYRKLRRDPVAWRKFLDRQIVYYKKRRGQL